MTVRDARPEDLPAIADIMNHYRTHTTHIWDRRLVTAETMDVWLHEHQTLPYCALVAEEDGKILGYASLSRFRPSPGYIPTAEDSIYLLPGYEGRGCGAALMETLLERARRNGLRIVTAWIDSRNTTSVKFHERMGFWCAGMLENVGVVGGEPASVVIMQTDMLRNLT